MLIYSLGSPSQNRFIGKPFSVSYFNFYVIAVFCPLIFGSVAAGSAAVFWEIVYGSKIAHGNFFFFFFSLLFSHGLLSSLYLWSASIEKFFLYYFKVTRLNNRKFLFFTTSKRTNAVARRYYTIVIQFLN